MITNEELKQKQALPLSDKIELSKEYIIDDEVFVVISGIPEKNDNLECAIAMAPLRSQGNTAFMLKGGSFPLVRPARVGSESIPRPSMTPWIPGKAFMTSSISDTVVRLPLKTR